MRSKRGALFQGKLLPGEEAQDVMVKCVKQKGIEFCGEWE
ncbi:hypothetical protein DOT_0219 [Desulfosporosinus sp. OT]|nr:hypothetical protein DOT_0219 [Desulfosporosinus sp. OT]